MSETERNDLAVLPVKPKPVPPEEVRFLEGAWTINRCPISVEQLEQRPQRSN